MRVRTRVRGCVCVLLAFVWGLVVEGVLRAFKALCVRFTIAPREMHMPPSGPPPREVLHWNPPESSALGKKQKGTFGLI